MNVYLHQVQLNSDKYTVIKLTGLAGSNCLYESPTGEVTKVNARDINKPKKSTALKTTWMWLKFHILTLRYLRG